MSRHDLDAVALFFGLLFALVGLGALLVEVDAVEPTRGSTWAVLLIAAGGVGLVTTFGSRARRDGDAASGSGSEAQAD